MNTGPVTSRSEFQVACHALLAAAVEARSRELWLCDADFAQWPLGERAFVERLVEWVGPGRSVRVMAHDYDTVVRMHPRWVEWRCTWSHVVDCRSLGTLERDAVPTLFVAPGVGSLRLVDLARLRGVASAEPAEIASLLQQCDALLQHSEAGLPPTLLGL